MSTAASNGTVAAAAGAGTTGTVLGAGGVRIAVHRSGDRNGPLVLLVHGFPDDHGVWDGVAAVLEPHHDVVRLDTRGSGASDRPRRVSSYGVAALARDLEAVIDDVADGRPVHVVGHDWGSVQAWHLVTTTDRPIASFTSISGPCIDQVPAWALARLREGPKGWRKILSMWKSPIYMTAFQVPVLAPLLCRVGAIDAVIGAFGRLEGGAAPAGLGGRARRNHAALKIYTANFWPRILRPRRRGTDVPVQVLAPRRDIFIPRHTQVDLDPGVTTGRALVIDGGHWVPAHHPELIASHVATWVAQHADTDRSGAHR